MTTDEFRSTASLRDILREALSRDVVQTALALVKSKNETVPIPMGLSGIDCGVALSERNTRAIFVQELFELTVPIPDVPAEAPPETFGTPHTVDDFDKPQPE